MCSWKGLLLLACTANLVLLVASDDDDTQVTADTGITASVEATGDTSDTLSTYGAGCAPKCKKNEVYTNCTGGCIAYKCSELGFPLKCDSNCTPGCNCKDTFLKADNGTCIPRDQCPSCAGDSNAKSGCGSFCIKCSNYNKQPIACPASCILNGCECRTGYIYDSNIKKCVLPTDCTPTCPLNEVYSACTNGGCDARNCSQVGKPVPCVKIDPKYCIKGCVCATGYLRLNGKCVPTDQCTPTCTGQNEYFANCIQGCSNQTCDSIGKIYHCPRQTVCKTGCRCNPGFFRNTDGVCIEQSQCPQQCGDNEYFDKCISGCSNQTCDDIGKIFNCPLETDVCRTGCRCNNGFWRNKDNKCVAESQCPTPPCPEGETYNRCPTVKCDGDYCPKTKDSPQTCPVGIICDPPRCTCGFNDHRDRKTGKCIATSSCPPFPCGVNEEYHSCSGGCEGEQCSDYINDTKCPPFRIGIVVPCRPQCRCKTGYFRNDKSVCIIGYKCGPKKSSNTTIITTPVTKAPPTDNPGTNPGTTTGSGVADLQAGVTAFTGQFLYDRIKANSGDNIIISAYSVFTPLAQLALYADGKALDQILSVLNLKSKDAIRTYFPTLAALGEGQTNVTYAAAAKVYANINYPLSDAFNKDSVAVFHAESQNVDFSKPAAAAALINAWVESQTNDKIMDLVSADMFSGASRLVLVNALYFKGNWLNAFNKNNTNDADFYLADGTTKTTKLMYQQGNFNYAEIDDLDCKVIELLYQGKNFSMVIALPNKNDGLLPLAEKLVDVTQFNRIVTLTRNVKVEVYMPPFEITTTTDLADILQLQNVTQIFNESNSGLSGMLATPEDVYVSKAIQKAFIKTDETGSEAAAANAIVVTTLALPLNPPKPIVFRADHAFLFYIKFGSTVLFSGAFYG